VKLPKLPRAPKARSGRKQGLRRRIAQTKGANESGRTFVRPLYEAPRRRLAKSEADGAAPIRGLRSIITSSSSSSLPFSPWLGSFVA
jgi:hypothetical protein